MSACPAVRLLDLGMSCYDEALALQHTLRAERRAGTGCDTLVLTEHRPVLTLGVRADGSHLLISEDDARARGVQVARVDRGGDITYHGPGQMVVYPILQLAGFRQDVRWYVRSLEETAIRLLATYGLTGERRSGMPGVWAGAGKIASVGVHISRWATMHGIAINIAPDLTPFSWINPCGYPGLVVTSVERETGAAPDMAEAKERFAAAFADVFECRVCGGPRLC